ncbi:MAG: hypothetical protein HY074_13715 [Deltaproteobacteria bacterium]|nr:hypothetical protein [Deltaproteobacteria bacterium]
MFRFLLPVLLLFPLAGIAHATGDDIIFDPRILPTQAQAPHIPEGGFAGPIMATGFKKIPGDDALNQWSFDFETGAFENHASTVGQTEWKNLYLAFAIDVRYLRDCYGSKTTALCTFYHSSVQLSGNLTWSDVKSTDRYSVMLIPIEYVTGTFGKAGLDLGTTNGALYATAGLRAEAVRDLGLGIQNRIQALLNLSINYASPEQGLGPTAAFHWIGSVRLFAGGASSEMAGVSPQGAITGGIETQMGLALDLNQGAVSFTNTTRLEGDIGLGGAGLGTGMITDRLELKYLHSVCRDEKKGGCNVPRSIAYGAGVRFEYSTSAYQANVPSGSVNVDRSVQWRWPWR